MQTITSIKDERVELARQLSSASGRSRLGKLLLHGIEGLQWGTNAGLEIEYLFVSTKGADSGTLGMLDVNLPCYGVTDGILKKITDTAHVISPLGVAMAPLPTPLGKSNTILVMDGVVDHGNIGSIIRTACAFGITDIATTTPDIDIYYRNIINASRGTALSVSYHSFHTPRSACEQLISSGYHILVTSPHAKSNVMNGLCPKPLAIVVGNETTGVSSYFENNAYARVKIPMFSHVESLNVSVATGIVLYELLRAEIHDVS